MNDAKVAKELKYLMDIIDVAIDPKRLSLEDAIDLLEDLQGEIDDRIAGMREDVK